MPSLDFDSLIILQWTSCQKRCGGLGWRYLHNNLILILPFLTCASQPRQSYVMRRDEDLLQCTASNMHSRLDSLNHWQIRFLQTKDTHGYHDVLIFPSIYWFSCGGFETRLQGHLVLGFRLSDTSSCILFEDSASSRKRREPISSMVAGQRTAS